MKKEKSQVTNQDFLDEISGIIRHLEFLRGYSQEKTGSRAKVNTNYNENSAILDEQRMNDGRTIAEWNVRISMEMAYT